MNDVSLRHQALRILAMGLLALYPLLNWYEIPFPITLGMTLVLAVSVLAFLIPGFKFRVYPVFFYVLMLYVFAVWSYQNGFGLWTLLPPGGVLFFIFLLTLGGGVLLFDLKSLRTCMGIVVAIAVPLFWIQFIALHTTGEKLCFVPKLTGLFSYESMTYAEIVTLHKSRLSPSSIFLEKSYMAYYLVAYLCLRLFSPDMRSKFLTPVNIVLILTLLMLRSGSGIVGLAVLIVVKILMLYNSGNKRRWYVVFLLIPLLAALSFVYLRSEIGESLSERTIELSTEGTSGYARVVAGYVVYGTMSPVEMLFGTNIDNVIGYSDVNYISEDKFYVNGVQTILMRVGIVGLLLYLLFYGSVFRKGDILAKMSIITLLLFSLLESDYLNPYHLLLTVIPCAIVFRQDNNRVSFDIVTTKKWLP